MSDSPDKASSSRAQEATPCRKCHKPFAKAAKFTVSSWFQTDPGDGLSRWQECCKCGLEKALSEDDLPFAERDAESEFISVPEPVDQEAPDGDSEIRLVVTDEEMEHVHSIQSDVNPDAQELISPAVEDATPAQEALDASASANAEETSSSATELPSEPELDAGSVQHTQLEAPGLHSNESESGSPSQLQHESATNNVDVAPLETHNETPSSAPVAASDSALPVEASVSNTEESSNSPETVNGTHDTQDRVEPAAQMQSANVLPPAAVPPSPMVPAAAMTPQSIPAPSQSHNALPSISPGPASTPSPSQSYMIGGRYEVDSVIGKGTFGPTYKARDVATDKLLCLKMVSTPISRHKRVVKRILQEVEKSKTLTHPHIVPIYDSGIDKSGRPFYIMDLIDQGSLKKAVKQEGFLDVPEVIDIFLDVCEALSYAHEHGMLHRDLKPSNILLSGSVNSRRAKVCDFGIIKALPSVGSEALEMTQSTDVFADPSCMSPEQCLGRRVDVRSDIYSLGCSMYEAIVGKKVFTGPNPLSVVVQHFKASPKSFDSVMYNCDISQHVEAVVMKMLEKSPEHRYQDVSQVVEDLRLLKAHRKPNFAYQKKKGSKHPLLPFGSKQEEPDSAEKMLDVVMLKKNWKGGVEDWNNDPRQQIARDINKLSAKRTPEVDRKPPAQEQREVREIREPRKVEAYGTGQAIGEVKQPPALPNWRGPELESRGDEIWARESAKPRKDRDDVILPGRMQAPKVDEANQGGAAANAFNYAVRHPAQQLPAVSKRRNLPFVEPEEEEPEVVVNRKMLPVYRASDSYPANAISLFCTEEDEEESERRIVTVEQAKREIPDYLLQVSRPANFGQATLPLLIASITIVMMLMMLLQLFAK